MLALPRLNSDHRHARVDKQPGHKGDGDTLSPPALVVFELSVTQGMKSSRQSWSRHGLHFKGALSPTLQSDSLRSTSISLPGCNPRWNPGQVSGEWGATLGVNKPPTAFLRRADDSNKNLSSSALWGARSLSRGKLFYCTLPAVRVRFKWRGSARNASWTSCWWGIPWGTMGAPPRYYPQLGGAHRQHGVVVRHLFYTWTPPCLVCRAQGCYSKGCWCWDVHIPNQCAHFCLCYVYSCSLVDWARRLKRRSRLLSFADVSLGVESVPFAGGSVCRRGVFPLRGNGFSQAAARIGHSSTRQTLSTNLSLFH